MSVCQAECGFVAARRPRFLQVADPGEECILKTSLWKKAVVEHKAQTHFEGFALLSGLFCCGYPAARVYL
jgi:hypothetical protein